MNGLEVLYYLSFILCAAYSIRRLFADGIHLANGIGIYIVVLTCIELVILLLMKKNILNAETIRIIYKVILTLIFLFCTFLFYSRTIKNISKLIGIFFIITTGILILNNDLFNKQFNTDFGIIISLYIITLCLLWYLNKIMDASSQSIFIDPFFWYTTGFILWSSIFLLRILPAEFLQFRDDAFLQMLQNMNFSVNIISNALFSIGLLQSSKSRDLGQI